MRPRDRLSPRPRPPQREAPPRPSSDPGSRDPGSRDPEGPEPSVPTVQLESDRLSRGPWVYGRQAGRRLGPGPVYPGELVEVLDASGRFVGHALHNPRSDIRLRFLNRGRRRALDRPEAFLEERLREADRLRRRTLGLEATGDAYRVAHAEGDDLPGLVVDRLGDVLVCEHHSQGFWALRAEVTEALGALYPGFPVLHRVPRSARGPEGFRESEEPGAFAELPEVAPPGTAPPGDTWITENGLRFRVRPGIGHKTGWFCDQRENRLRIGALAAGRTVLDLCTNGGGFALQAARAGARHVLAADLDEAVLEQAEASARENGLDIELVHADLFHLLRDARLRGAGHDLVILDPPKWVQGRGDLEAGKKKYLDANALALEACRPGGCLATFSCSGALSLEEFLGTLFAAARRAGRDLRLLQTLEAGPDHPQRPDFSRSRYLKGALVAVDSGRQLRDRR